MDVENIIKLPSLSDIINQDIQFQDIIHTDTNREGVFAVKEGILDFVGIANVRVYVLNTGIKAFDEGDVLKLRSILQEKNKIRMN